MVLTYKSFLPKGGIMVLEGNPALRHVVLPLTYKQYYSNEQVINPAYAGSHVKLSATAMYRNQWVNFPGAPKTYNFSSHTSLLKNKIGVGIMFNEDEIGSYKNNHVYGYYAYKIHLADATFSMGLQAGFNLLDADFSALDLQHPGDVSFYTLTGQIKPNRTLVLDFSSIKRINSSEFTKIPSVHNIISIGENNSGSQFPEARWPMSGCLLTFDDSAPSPIYTGT